MATWTAAHTTAGAAEASTTITEFEMPNGSTEQQALEAARTLLRERGDNPDDGDLYVYCET